MLARYRALTLDAILAAISPSDILYAAVQGGGDDWIKAFIAEETASDQGLIRVLGALLSTMTTSKGSYEALTRESIAVFLDPDSVRTRLSQIAADGAQPDLAVPANALLAAIEMAKRF